MNILIRNYKTKILDKKIGDVRISLLKLIVLFTPKLNQIKHFARNSLTNGLDILKVNPTIIKAKFP